MKKHSLPVRVAALACALCLLLTGCGQAARPDDPGEAATPAPTAEPVTDNAAPEAEGTSLTIEDLKLTAVEELAAQLAAEHLGEDAVLTDVVELSSGDSDPDAYHVLLLKDSRKNYLAYRYGTGSVYCLSEEEAQDYHENVQDPETDACTYLLYILSHRTDNYLNDEETVTKLAPSEVEEVNRALAQGEVLAPAAEEAKAAQEELEAAQLAAQHAAAAPQAAELAAQLAAEYLGKDAVLASAVDFSIDDFEGAPCHVLLLRNADDRFLAYSYDTETVYCPSWDDFGNGTDDFSTEEGRCFHLLRTFAERSDCYYNNTETLIELTAAEIAQVNGALLQGDAAAQEETEAAQLAEQLAAEYLGHDTTLIHVVDYSVDDFEGAPCHVLLLRDANDRFLAYSYDTDTVYCPDDVLNHQSDDMSTEEERCYYLLLALYNSSMDSMDYYLYDGETRIELTAAEIAKINEALVSEEVQPAADDATLTALEMKAAQLAAAAIKAQAVQAVSAQWGQDAVLTDVADYSIDDFEGVPCHVLLLKDTGDRYLAYSYDSETVYCPSSDDVQRGTDDWSTEERRCLYLLWMFCNHTGVYWNSEETRTELTAAEIAKVNGALARGIAPVAAEETETRPAEAALPKGSGVYKVLSECPEEFSRRELSDKEILALAQGDLETAREGISTGGDFAAWLIALGGEISSNIVSNPDGQKTIGADFSFECSRQMIDSTSAAALAARVLGDDLPGISVVAARVAEHDGTFLCGSLIPADGGYYLISFDALTDEWKAAVEADRIIPEAFPVIWVDGFAGITAWCQSADNPRGSTLTQAFYIPGDQHVVLDYKDELYIPQSPSTVQEFFRDEALAADLTEQKTAHIQPENIGNFVLSTKLGGTTLTPEEAYALLDMEPEQVKERVKTAADVLMLMLAGQYGDCHGDRNVTIDGQEWHYNLNAFQVMQTHTTNCGSAANLANYLLEGDYEEIGFILQTYYIDGGGGHVYNYFKYQGKYYIVDFSWYMFGNYRPENDFPVMELDRLEDYGSRIPELYGGVCMALAHTSPGQHYPNVFDAQNKAYAIPAGVEYKLLYQETGSNCYILKEYPLDKSKLDWTTFGEP